MQDREELEGQQRRRREFLSGLGSALACGAAAAAASSVATGTVAATAAAAATETPPNPAIPGYDWTQHRWAFGVDATKCIGCLRCVEACKKENGVPEGPYFRTWIERYIIEKPKPGSGQTRGETETRQTKTAHCADHGIAR